MRTTLTLDDDVAKALDRFRKEHDLSFKEVVNRALRAGLVQLEEPPATPAYRVRPAHLGRPRIPDLDDIGELLAIIEGEAYR